MMYFITFRNWLIKKLGGYTISDMVKATNQGRRAVAFSIKQHADALYGSDIQTWVNDLYKYLSNVYLTEYSTGNGIG